LYFITVKKLNSMSVGAAVKPVVFFTPNWTPVHQGESVTLSCNVAPTAQGNLGYSWYRDGHQISGVQQNLVIQSGTWSDNGKYQCQLGTNDISDPVPLHFKFDWLILQAPPAVHEGDSLSLRCHSRPGLDAKKPVFYKDNKAIGPPVSGSELQIGRVGVTASGTYRCDKEIYFYYAFGNGYRTYKDEQYISVSELFSAPQIKVRPNQVTEGDAMNVTCDTELSSHRETTELQFAFYRNGHNVQGFRLSNQYGVPSAELEDSGNYTCEVQTPTGSVRKRTTPFPIHSFPSISENPKWVTRKNMSNVRGSLNSLSILGSLPKVYLSN
uniref:Ig-like domain-containing protein n=1 Tax=Xenopus tropicalis TaxID=8364 RepID=F6V763_XENTR